MCTLFTVSKYIFLSQAYMNKNIMELDCR